MDDDLLFAEVDLGLAAKEFFNSDVGRYVKGRAGQELMTALAALELANAGDSMYIAEQQLKARTARNVIHWLNEVISNGEQAEVILHESDAGS